MPTRTINGRIYEEVAVTGGEPLEVTYPDGYAVPIDLTGATITVEPTVTVNNTSAAPVPVQGVANGTAVPVSGPLTDTQLRATPVTVALNTGSTLSVSNFPATQPVSGPLTDAQLRASSIAVNDGSSTLSVDDGGGSITVDGPLTDTQLRANAVPITGGFLTNTELRATAVPVSGPLTDTQLRATAVPVTAVITSTVSPAAVTPTTTQVSSSTGSQTILALNANRKGFMVCNVSTAKLFLSFSTPATQANAFIQLAAGETLTFDRGLIVTAAIYGLWNAVNGAAQVTEFV